MNESLSRIGEFFRLETGNSGVFGKVNMHFELRSDKSSWTKDLYEAEKFLDDVSHLEGVQKVWTPDPDSNCKH